MDSTNPLFEQYRNKRPGFLYRWLLSRLQRLPISRLELVSPRGKVDYLGVEREGIPVARIQLMRHRAVLRAVQGGLLGWAEAYMAGEWDSPNLMVVTDWAMANEAALEQAFSGTFVMQGLNRILHRLRQNSRRGSRKNIRAHYDLGNPFYQQWLDRSMSYSSGLYLDADVSLEQAQQNKYQRIIELLGTCKETSLLEVGCGWGGLAQVLVEEEAIATYKGVTLSDEQLAFAKTRLKDHQQCQLLLQDYRDVTGTYDCIASIEMIEAVGEEHWPVYFNTLARCLNADGRIVIQSITIDNARFDSYRASTDFIQKYIFPGGFLPSDEHIHKQADAANLCVEHTECFGADYAITLREWHRRFNQQWPVIAAQGFDETFWRMWNYYLAYCQAGFESDSIDVRLYVLKHRG